MFTYVGVQEEFGLLQRNPTHCATCCVWSSLKSVRLRGLERSTQTRLIVERRLEINLQILFRALASQKNAAAQVKLMLTTIQICNSLLLLLDVVAQPSVS